ncbi:hypothetical protein [Pseudoxanthomonas mexicana]
MEDGRDLSWGTTPNAEDVATIDSAIAEFEAAAEPKAEDIFEGRLTELARAISDRYTQTKDDAWLDELHKLASATEQVEAENISGIVDALLYERPSLSALRDTRNFGLFRRDYSPDDAIYQSVDTTGVNFLATANKYRLNAKGNPVFEGRVDILKADGSIIDSFDFVTGSGSRSHTITNGPLPPGRYSAHAFRMRDDPGFVVDGIGYSINLDERDGTKVNGRKYFRIHPDGWPRGTKGCIGISGDKARQRAAMELFKAEIDAPGRNGVALFAMRYER